jgi:hypothetical protein
MSDLSELLDELHAIIWEAGKSAKPLDGYPVSVSEKGAFRYGKDCATADIEQAVFKCVTRALKESQQEIRDGRNG